MNYRVTHRTVYEYSDPVTVSHHTARLEPRVTAGQQCVASSLVIRPEPAMTTARTDYFGNHVSRFTIQELHRRLEITSVSEVRINANPPPAPALSSAWEDVAALFREPVAADLLEPYQFIFDSPLLAGSPELAEFARSSFPEKAPLLSAALDLNRRIFREFQYDKDATTIATPLAEVLAQRRGVCQDFAHVAIACLRSLGLPARYVSGYLRTRAAEGRQRLIGADASHAWFSIFCPGYGWVDFDPTNDLMPHQEHITIACGRDFSDVSPVAGIVTGGGRHDLKVSVDVEAMGA